MPVSRKSNKRNKFSKRSKNVRTIKKTRKHIRKMQGGGHCIEHIYRDRIGDTFLFQDSEKEYKLTKCLTYGPNLYYELIPVGDGHLGASKTQKMTVHEDEMKTFFKYIHI